MNFVPGNVPRDPERLAEYLARELQRLAASVRDDAQAVFYRTLAVNQGSLTAGVSANYKIAPGNVIRISASLTVTLTAIYDKTPYRERVLLSVGTAPVVLKSEGSESSASYRFLLSSAAWNLSANAAAVVWYDPISSRHRGISRTP